MLVDLLGRQVGTAPRGMCSLLAHACVASQTAALVTVKTAPGTRPRYSATCRAQWSKTGTVLRWVRYSGGTTVSLERASGNDRSLPFLS